LLTRRHLFALSGAKVPSLISAEKNSRIASSRAAFTKHARGSASRHLLPCSRRKRIPADAGAIRSLLKETHPTNSPNGWTRRSGKIRTTRSVAILDNLRGCVFARSTAAIRLTNNSVSRAVREARLVRSNQNRYHSGQTGDGVSRSAILRRVPNSRRPFGNEAPGRSIGKIVAALRPARPENRHDRRVARESLANLRPVSISPFRADRFSLDMG